MVSHGQRLNNRREDILEVINKRRSVRSFNDKPISDDLLELIVRAGMQAPTAVNQQANCFFVIRKKENLLKIKSELTNASMFDTATAAIVVLIDKSKLKREHMKSQDAASATTNILLAATNLGMGSCWCGIYPNQDRMDKLTEIINVSEKYIVFSLIALGYPKDENALRFIDRYDDRKVFFD